MTTALGLLGRLGLVLVTSSLTGAVVASGAAAPSVAAERELRPVVTLYKAQVEACKVRVDGGTKVQVFARLDNSANRRPESRTANLYVYRDATMTSKALTLPETPGGRTSRTKSMTFPTGGRISLGIGIGTGQMGDGRQVALSAIRAC